MYCGNCTENAFLLLVFSLYTSTCFQHCCLHTSTVDYLVTLGKLGAQVIHSSKLEKSNYESSGQGSMLLMLPNSSQHKPFISVITLPKYNCRDWNFSCLVSNRVSAWIVQFFPIIKSAENILFASHTIYYKFTMVLSIISGSTTT